MASIRKRGGRYQVRIKISGFPEQTRSFRSRSDGEPWAKVVETESISLHEALVRYLAEITPQKKSGKREPNLIARLQKHPLAKRSLASIRSVDIARYRDERRSQGLGANTVRIELALFSPLFKIARDVPFLDIDVAKAKLNWALLNGGKFRHKTVANTPEGYAALAEWLAKQGVDQTHRCLEATGL